jgi:hypothetical protein
VDLSDAYGRRTEFSDQVILIGQGDQIEEHVRLELQKEANQKILQVAPPPPPPPGGSVLDAEGYRFKNRSPAAASRSRRSFFQW